MPVLTSPSRPALPTAERRERSNTARSSSPTGCPQSRKSARPHSGVNPRTAVTVIGEGAVGLSAVLSAKRLGAERIILMGHHKDRTDLGVEFGATDVVAERA